MTFDPSKWQLAPKEPTKEMKERGEAALSGWIAPAMHPDDAYKAMLAVAPKAPVVVGDVIERAAEELSREGFYVEGNTQDALTYGEAHILAQRLAAAGLLASSGKEAGTFDDGIEAAAKWHDERAADARGLIAKGQVSAADKLHWRDYAECHVHYASAIRALKGQPAPASTGLDEETIEAAARVFPEKSETFSYQAEGYADGWWACIEAYRKAIRALKSKPSPQVDYTVPSKEEIAADIPEVSELYAHSKPSPQVGRGDRIDANEMVPAPKGMNEYERSIREKVFAAKILSPGEWVYLVGAFHALNETEHAPAVSGEGWPLTKKAIWGALAAENLNDGHYIKLGELTERVFQAVARHFPASPSEVK